MSVETWQDGYRSGTKEAFEWCIRTTMEMGDKAKTEQGQKALRFMAALMQKDLDKRQPPPRDGESADPSPT